MEVIQRKRVHAFCHGIFHLLNVFKSNSTEILLHLEEQPKITGRKVWNISKRRDIFFYDHQPSPYASVLLFFTEHPRDLFAHILRMFISSWTIVCTVITPIPTCMLLSLETHDNLHTENWEFYRRALLFWPSRTHCLLHPLLCLWTSCGTGNQMLASYKLIRKLSREFHAFLLNV